MDASPRTTRLRRVVRPLAAVVAAALAAGVALLAVLVLLAESSGGHDVTPLLISRLDQRVKLFSVTHDRLPTSLDELFPHEETPVDPWGNPFVYEVRGPDAYEISSLGADGRPGGTGADADRRLADPRR